MAEQVDAVAARQIQIALTVEVEQFVPLGAFDEGAHAQAAAQVGAEREGHAVAAGELKVADHWPQRRRAFQRHGMPGVEQGGQAVQAGAAALLHGVRRAVGGEERRFVKRIGRQPARQARSHAAVTGQPRLLGQRELGAAHGLGRQPQAQHAGGTHGAEGQKFRHLSSKSHHNTARCSATP